MFKSVKLLLVGAIWAPRNRTVPFPLDVMGQSANQRFHFYHRVLKQTPCSALYSGRIPLRWLWRAFVPTGPVVMGIDEIIERRCGKKSAAKGIHREPTPSSSAPLVKASGLRWASLMLLLPNN